MAKNPVNISALVRDYLGKYPDMMPTALAEKISQEHGVKINRNFVATIKTKLKHASGTPAAASAPAKAQKRPAPVRTVPALASTAPLSLYITNLKAAVQRLGKDEAKRIIDLF